MAKHLILLATLFLAVIAPMASAVYYGAVVDDVPSYVHHYDVRMITDTQRSFVTIDVAMTTETANQLTIAKMAANNFFISSDGANSIMAIDYGRIDETVKPYFMVAAIRNEDNDWAGGRTLVWMTKSFVVDATDTVNVTAKIEEMTRLDSAQIIPFIENKIY